MTRTKRLPVVSCVVDRHPTFQMQAWLWLCSLRGAGAQGHLHPVLHHVGPCRQAFRDAVTALWEGAEIVEIEAFGTGPLAYCNKLQQLAPLTRRDAPQVILCDTDIAFAQSPHGLITGAAPRAKPVDLPNPDEATLRALLDEAGFGTEPLDTPMIRQPGARTHRFNCNGGLYVLPRDALIGLADRWPHWARFCLQSTALQGRFRLHSDQLGFMLAMLELGLPLDPLKDRDNYPLHLTHRLPDPAPDTAPDAAPETVPAVLHYHQKLGPDGQIEPTGIAQVDQVVNLINDRASAWLATGAAQRLLQRFQDGRRQG